MSGHNGNGKTGLWNGFWAQSGLTQQVLGANLLGETQFEQQLLRERARAERTGSVFTVLNMHLEGKDIRIPANGLLWKILSRVICERTRLMDVPGHYRGGVGLILPDTSRDAIPALVNSIEELFHKRIQAHVKANEHLPEISCKVFFWSDDRFAKTTPDNP